MPEGPHLIYDATCEHELDLAESVRSSPSVNSQYWFFLALQLILCSQVVSP